MSITAGKLRDELIDSIHQELIGVDDLLEAIDCCLKLMTNEQLGSLRMTLARGLPQAVSNGVFSSVVDSITKLLRETGKRLSDDEYRDFVRDVLSRIEYSELPE